MGQKMQVRKNNSPVHKAFYDNFNNDYHVPMKDVTRLKIEPTHGDSISIIPMADLHLGHKNCNQKIIDQHLEFIYMTPDCYTIFLGDELETATKQSVGMSVYEEDKHIPEQMQTMYEMLKPLAKQGKVLGMIPGNHSMRVAQLIGLNLTEELAKALRIPYLGYQGFIDLNVNDVNYNIIAFHGAGGGSMNGSKVASAEKISKVAIADLYIVGHTHIRHHTEDCIYEFENGHLVQRNRHYVTCGAFLEYFGGYAEMKGLNPSPTGSVVIELMADYKDIRVHI